MPSRASSVGERDSRGLLFGGTAALGARFYPTDALYIGVDGVARVLGGLLQRESAVFPGAGASVNVGLAF